MKSDRYVELDILRGIAILLMIVYHTAYDLRIFYGWNIAVFDGRWWLLARSTAVLFLLLVGVGAAISHGWVAASRRDAATIWKRSIRRFIRIGSAAALVTVATYIIDPGTYVRFGILHLIAVSALVMPVVAWLWTGGAETQRRCVSATIMIAIIIIIIGPIANVTTIPTSLLLPLGFSPAGFQTVDYFPIIPWFGVILIGYVIGWYLYIDVPRVGGPRRSVAAFPQTMIRFSGRHSLLVYLVHQPVILGVLWVMLGSWK